METVTPQSTGQVINRNAPDFTLNDHQGGLVTLSKVFHVSPTLLVFYPADFTAVCTSQLCDYRDHMEEFQDLGVQVFGISKNDARSHAKFAEEHRFPFLLLSDPGHKVAKAYGCSSLFMLGKVSRAVFIVNTQGLILYRYVEPTVITRRKASELLGVIRDMKQHGIL